MAEHIRTCLILAIQFNIKGQTDSRRLPLTQGHSDKSREETTELPQGADSVLANTSPGKARQEGTGTACQPAAQHTAPEHPCQGALTLSGLAARDRDATRGDPPLRGTRRARTSPPPRLEVGGFGSQSHGQHLQVPPAEPGAPQCRQHGRTISPCVTGRERDATRLKAWPARTARRPAGSARAPER